MAKKGIRKERILEKVSGTSHGAISHRVPRYMLALWKRQAPRGRGKKEGGLMSVACGWRSVIDAEKGTTRHKSWSKNG